MNKTLFLTSQHGNLNFQGNRKTASHAAVEFQKTSFTSFS